ncbi:MAG TPA: redoxin domain-containing protein [Vicinamibacterales bacterium]|nr:redoxin domain-containing protein [Vicinamibacterales bacterium]
MKTVLTWCAGLGLMLSALAVAPGAAPAELKPGDPAPPFNLPGTDDRMHSLEEYRGTTVVLAWFPKAFTGG